MGPRHLPLLLLLSLLPRLPWISRLYLMQSPLNLRVTVE
jgi:hypothetical protein